MLLFSGYVFSERCFSIIGDMLFVNIFVTFMIIVVVSCRGGKRVRCRPRKGVSEIRVLGCETARIISRGCEGRCSSSAIPNITGAFVCL